MGGDVERVEQCRSRMWRGMVWNRWLYVAGVLVQLVVFVLAVLSRSGLLLVLSPTLLVVHVVAHRRYVAYCVESDRYWQQSLDFWRDRES
jgi:hypothetical protein